MTKPIYGKWGTPLLYAIMADSDVGKTFDEINTWRGQGFYLGEPASIRKVAAAMGQTVKVRSTLRLQDTVKVLRSYKAKYADVPPDKRPYLALIEDDASLKLAADKARIWRQVPAAGRGTYERWDRLQNLVSDFALAQRAAAVHLHCSFHHDRGKDAEIVDGKRQEARKAGMATPGPSLGRILTHHFDVLVFAAPDEARWPWPVSVLGRPPNDEEHTKDRHGYYRQRRPFNTREVLRHLGYRVGACPSWEEDATAQIAELLREVEPDAWAQASREAFQALAKVHGNSQAYLALFNAACRVDVERHNFYTDIFSDD